MNQEKLRLLRGQALEAFERHDSEHLFIQENDATPRVGRAANRVFEKKPVDSMQENDDGTRCEIAVQGDVT